MTDGKVMALAKLAAGSGVFSGPVRTTDGTVAIINQDMVKGTAPDSELKSYLVFYDKVDDAKAASIDGKHAMAIVRNAYSATANSLQLQIFDPVANATTNKVLAFRATTSATYDFLPGNNNAIALGGSNNRWSAIYSATNVNVSSDERVKSGIGDIPDAVLDAWADVDWQQFQMIDAVEEKGAEKARMHAGLVAQRIEEAFKAHGLDAGSYGFFCHDAWEAQPEQRDDDGNVTWEAVEAGDIYSLRYAEALCIEAAYQRRRADRLEERLATLERQRDTGRIKALEQRLAEMEAVIAVLGGNASAVDE